MTVPVLTDLERNAVIVIANNGRDFHDLARIIDVPDEEAREIFQRAEAKLARGANRPPATAEPSSPRGSATAADNGSAVGTGPTVEPAATNGQQSRQPVLDAMRELGRPTNASELAGIIGRKTENVATRLRQYELEDPPKVRRTGRSVGGLGRGGPRIEWELAAPTDVRTGPELSLESPLSPPTDRAVFRRAYFDALFERLAIAEGDAFDQIADRIERLLGEGVSPTPTA